MELEEVYRRDLNLLVALKVLLEEGSVSRAAHRLHLSQSAMSRVLGRLRELLNDPLLIRQGQQLIPTERALEISGQLDQPLEQLRHLLVQDDFDPRTCDKRFVIATTDYAMQTILPFALPRIYQEAPGIQLEFPPVQHEQLLDQLSAGCDMAINRPEGSVEPLHSSRLGPVSVFCLLSKKHPLAQQELTLKDYLNYPHALIAISDGVKALIDEALRGTEPQRKMVLRAYHLQAALAIVDTMPLIITVPADLAYLVADKHDLVIKSLPFEFKPFDYWLIWHPRCDHSAAQLWLRRLLTEECGRLINQRIKDMGLA
ncbi:LysR family transcriptional regulator [Endozoicomonadaceae bacterium StTr2]